jgi:hypothetical protein
MDLHHLHRLWAPWQGIAAAAEAWQDSGSVYGTCRLCWGRGPDRRYLYMQWLTWRAHTRLLVEYLCVFELALKLVQFYSTKS